MLFSHFLLSKWLNDKLLQSLEVYLPQLSYSQQVSYIAFQLYSVLLISKTCMMVI